MLTFKLPESLEKRLDKLAKNNPITKDRYMREAIENFIEKNEGRLLARAHSKKKS
jgi:predicted DNA-binding protein